MLSPWFARGRLLARATYTLCGFLTHTCTHVHAQQTRAHLLEHIQSHPQMLTSCHLSGRKESAPVVYLTGLSLRSPGILTTLKSSWTGCAGRSFTSFFSDGFKTKPASSSSWAALVSETAWARAFTRPKHRRERSACASCIRRSSWPAWHAPGSPARVRARRRCVCACVLKCCLCVMVVRKEGRLPLSLSLYVYGVHNVPLPDHALSTLPGHHPAWSPSWPHGLWILSWWFQCSDCVSPRLLVHTHTYTHTVNRIHRGCVQAGTWLVHALPFHSLSAACPRAWRGACT